MIGYAIRLAAVAALASAISASAQIPTDRPIGAVEIRGLERVSEQLVRSQLEVQPGQLYNPLAIARDIRRLFNLGRFADVQAEYDIVGGDLVITSASSTTSKSSAIAKLKIAPCAQSSAGKKAIRSTKTDTKSSATPFLISIDPKAFSTPPSTFSSKKYQPPASA